MDAIKEPASHRIFQVIIAPKIGARILMTRDMELIRRILTEIQSRNTLTPALVEIGDYAPVLVGRHVEMLFKEGYIEGMAFPNHTEDKGYADVFVTDLSWAGHDFIAALENDSVWNKIKQTFSPKELATMPLSVIKDIAVAALKAYAMRKMGFSDQ